MWLVSAPLLCLIYHLLVHIVTHTHAYPRTHSYTHKQLPKEAFLFQVMSDDTGNHSLWVAQRVPDDHVGTVMNAFTVREVRE